jgi:D-glycero-D-manno-heptose 1,7-bisphosphate phosphatase
LRRIVVTNQPELARGSLDRRTLDRMHEILRAAMDLDDLFLCSHDPSEGCECHKPRPGLLHAAAARWHLDLRESFLVGDRWRDIGAGAAAGCYTILIERPYSRCDAADARVASLADAVGVILARLDRPPAAERQGVQTERP